MRTGAATLKWNQPIYHEMKLLVNKAPFTDLAIRIPQDMYDELFLLLPRLEQECVKENGIKTLSFMGYEVIPYKAGYLNVT